MFCQSLFVILYFFLSSLHYLSYDLRLLVTTLVSCGHCVVCHLRFTASDLPLWYLVAIVLSVIYDLRLLVYHFGILWPLCCLSSTIYGFWFTTLVHASSNVSADKVWKVHDKSVVFFSFLFFSIQIPTDTKENICCCNFTLYCCLIDNLHTSCSCLYQIYIYVYSLIMQKSFLFFLTIPYINNVVQYM